MGKSKELSQDLCNLVVHSYRCILRTIHEGLQEDLEEAALAVSKKTTVHSTGLCACSLEDSTAQEQRAEADEAA